MLPESWGEENHTQHILLHQDYLDTKQDKKISRQLQKKKKSCVNIDAKNS